MITVNSRFGLILLSIFLLLLLPLVAMQFTDEVDWTLFDFVVMGSLLFITGLCCELTLRKVKTLRHRLILCGSILLVFLLIWAELAVGIFGSPFAGS